MLSGASQVQLYNHNIARVLRAIQKQQGSSQADFAKKFGVSGATMTRMLRGETPPEFAQLVQACDLVGQVDLRKVITRGLIERGGNPTLKDVQLSGVAFKLPARFCHQAGTTARVLNRIYLPYLERRLGPQKILQMFDYIGMDPDYLVFQDHQVNIQFTLDLIQHIGNLGLIDEQVMYSLTLPFFGPGAFEFQGFVTPARAVASFIRQCNQFDCNTGYRVLSEGDFHVSFEYQPHAHTNDFKIRDKVGSFFCNYAKSTYSHCARAMDPRCHITLTEKYCMMKGDGLCQMHLHIRPSYGAGSKKYVAC